MDQTSSRRISKVSTIEETTRAEGVGEHHRVTIVVNTRHKAWDKDTISYAELVKLAFPNPTPGIEFTYTITYRNGDHHKPEGSITEGQSVKVKDGEIFNVTETRKS